VIALLRARRARKAAQDAAIAREIVAEAIVKEHRYARYRRLELPVFDQLAAEQGDPRAVASVDDLAARAKTLPTTAPVDDFLAEVDLLRGPIATGTLLAPAEKEWTR